MKHLTHRQCIRDAFMSWNFVLKVRKIVSDQFNLNYIPLFCFCQCFWGYIIPWITLFVLFLSVVLICQYFYGTCISLNRIQVVPMKSLLNLLFQRQYAMLRLLSVEKKHKGTARSHTERLLWGNCANHCTTIQPNQYYYHVLILCIIYCRCRWLMTLIYLHNQVSQATNKFNRIDGHCSLFMLFNK